MLSRAKHLNACPTKAQRHYQIQISSHVMLSNCVECQGVLGDKFGFLRLSIAFKMHTSLCMAATSATLLGLPRSISR
jgi:hypothetical protein